MALRSPPLKSNRSLGSVGRVCGSLLVFLFLSPVQNLAQPRPLEHQTIEQQIEKFSIGPESSYRFAVFGDQQSLWRRCHQGGQFERLLSQVASLSVEDDGLLFMIDTGDIVDKGGKAKQFEGLRQRLGLENQALPYLVAVGNHELEKTSSQARRHTAAFLGYLDDSFSLDRMNYSKQIGPVRFLFLDTNQLPDIYVSSPNEDPDQIEWLDEQLSSEFHPTIVAVHHPFVLSASKHRDHARTLWNYEYEDGRTLPERLIEGGVDLVISGHVHSYEAFLLERNEREMWFFNVSGKPTKPRIFWNCVVVWKSQNSRRPQSWGNTAKSRLAAVGFDVEGWSEITQRDYLRKNEEANQFAVINVRKQQGQNADLEVEVRTVNGSVLYPDQ